MVKLEWIFEFDLTISCKKLYKSCIFQKLMYKGRGFLLRRRVGFLAETRRDFAETWRFSRGVQEWVLSEIWS